MNDQNLIKKKKVSPDYVLGLDIGTENNGHAALTDDFTVMKYRHVREIGVSQFEGAKTAEDRRQFRGVRRRINHKNWRLKELRRYFKPHFLDVGMNENEIHDYFLEFKGSWISKGDTTRRKRKFNQELHKFPTLFHAILALEGEGDKRWIEKVPKDDKDHLKLIYEVMHKLVKTRGNFLRYEKVSDFNSQKINIEKQLAKIGTIYNVKNSNRIVNLNKIDFSKIISQESRQDPKSFPDLLSKLKQKDDLLSIFTDPLIEKKIKKTILKNYLELALGNKKENKAFIDVIDKLIWGEAISKTQVKKVNKVFKVNLDKDDFGGLQFGQDNTEEQYEALRALSDVRGTEILDEIRKLYNVINLANIVIPGLTYAESMVQKYQEFGEQKGKLVDLINKLKEKDSKKATEISTTLSAYLNHHRKFKQISHDTFIKQLEKQIPEDSKILRKIKNNPLNFMQKQRNKFNSIIPHQLYQLEVRKIIEIQSKYPGFEWLKSHKNGANSKLFKDEKYDLERFIDYKIPYFIGPIIKNNKSKNSWVVFNSNKKLTIWNLEEIVDFRATAEKFIRRMTATDTYLLGQPVLAKSSITYQEYEVLNEISNIRYLKDNKKCGLTAKEQQDFVQKFKQKKSISKKNIANFLNVKENIISGLAKKDRFLSSMSTYIDFKRILGEIVDKYQYREALDQITEVLTIFEPNSFELKENRIKKIASESNLNLTKNQIDKLSHLSYSGWGKLSKKLLNSQWVRGKIKNNILTDGKEKYSILECMRNTSLNFAQLVNRKEIDKHIKDFNRQQMGDLTKRKEKIDFFLKNSRLSPMHDRSIRNLLEIVNEYTKFNGKAPKMISLENASDSIDPLPNMYSRILNLKDKLSGEKAVLAGLKNQNLTLKEYLYFTQNGKDIYDGKPLDYSQVNNSGLEIDHVYPQSINNKRNDLGNLVLTKSQNNQLKGAEPAILKFEKMKPFWKELYKDGLISKRKYRALTIDWKKDKSFAKGMIARSLVETRGIIKSTANILTMLYPDTKIVTISSGLTMGLRQAFNLYKVRNVNDFHHGVDAFLAAFSGLYMWNLYPKLRPVLDYNDYSKWDVPEDLVDIGLSALTSKDKKHPRVHNGQLINSDGEIVANRQDLINKLIRWRNPKFVRVIKHPMLSSDGNLYDATLYNTGNKLLPIKNNRDPQIYGGHKSLTTAYTMLLKDKRKGTYVIKNVPNIWIKEDLVNKIKSKYPDKEVILNKILPGTEFRINNDNKADTSFCVYSADGPTNNNQLYLPDDVMRFLKYLETHPSILKVNEGSTFNENQCSEFKHYSFLDSKVVENDRVQKVMNIALAKVLLTISNYSVSEIPLLASDEVIRTLNQIVQIFETDDLTQFDKKGNITRTSLEEKKYIIDEILSGFHANKKRCELKEKIVNSEKKIELNLGRKRSYNIKGNTLIVFNSITGFRKKVLKLSEL